MLPTKALLFLLMRSCEGGQFGDLIAVMGMEMTESAFLQLFTNNVSSFSTKCLVQKHLELNVTDSV